MKSTRCPHPKCNGIAQFIRKLGDVRWFVCVTCRFPFPDDDAKRPR